LDNKQALDLAIKDLKDNGEIYIEVPYERCHWPEKFTRLGRAASLIKKET